VAPADDRVPAGCVACAPYGNVVEIRRPDDLKRLAARARDAVAAGILVEASDVPTPASAPEQESVAAVSRGTWSDVVELHFRCATCSRRFTLSAETYHGSGGAWRQVP
jgi:hypothetical protein